MPTPRRVKERRTFESTHCPYCNVNLNDLPDDADTLQHLSGRCRPPRLLENADVLEILQTELPLIASVIGLQTLGRIVNRLNKLLENPAPHFPDGRCHECGQKEDAGKNFGGHLANCPSRIPF